MVSQGRSNITHLIVVFKYKEVPRYTHTRCWLTLANTVTCDGRQMDENKVFPMYPPAYAGDSPHAPGDQKVKVKRSTMISIPPEKA